MSNPFQELKELSSATKSIKLAQPDDIVSSAPQWSCRQLVIKDIEARGHPENGYKLELRENARTVEFKIRRLTASKQKECDALVDSILPPVKYEEKVVRMGEPPVRIPNGFDEDDPDYQKQLSAAKDDQMALVVLYGVDGLIDNVEGATNKEKIAALRGALDLRMIMLLANEIWGWSYAHGDPADFFTSATSGSTTRS